MLTHLVLNDSLRESLDLMDSGIFIVREDFSLAYTNRWIREHLPSDLANKSQLEDLYVSHNAPLVLAKFRQMFQHRTMQYISSAFHPWLLPIPDKRIANGLMRQRGSIRPVLVKENGTSSASICALVQLKDVTDLMLQIEKFKEVSKKQKASERDLSRLALVAQHTENAVVITDPNGYLEWVNAAFTEITGYTLEEVLGKTPGHILQGPETDPETVIQVREAIANQEAIKVEILNYSKSGEKYWLEMHIQPIFDAQGTLERFIAVESDITDRKFAEEALHDAFQTIKRQQAQLDEELEQARQTQRVLLPNEMPEIPHAKVVSMYYPMAQIGGDIYDVFRLKNDRFGLMVADVTGHGIPAALVSFMVSSVFKNSVFGVMSPMWVFDMVNHNLYEKLPESTFATLIYGIYDSTRQVLTYGTAGHPPALLISTQDNTIHELSTGSTMFGVFPNEIASFEEKEVQLHPGDKVLFYTDAIYEVDNGSYEQLGMRRLKHLIWKHRHLPMEEIIQKIYDYGLTYSMRENFGDDVTMVGLEVLESASPSVVNNQDDDPLDHSFQSLL